MTIEEDAMIVVVVMTGVVVMTAEVVMTGVVVMTAEVVMTEETIVAIFQTMIGSVRSVIIPTSHSELNVTAVVSQKEEEAQVIAMTEEVAMTVEVVMTETEVMTEEETQIPESGKVMTADQVIEKRPLNQELAIGNVPNVENQISLRETSVSVVDARKE